MRQIFARRMLRTSLLKISWARLQVKASGDMARCNYGMSISDEKCKDIAETPWLEENYLPSKSHVLQIGAPVYYTDTVSLPIEKQDKLKTPFTVPHNETLSPPLPSHGPPEIWSPLPHNKGSSPAPSANFPPDELHQPPPPYSPPTSQVKLFILKLRKI